MTDEKDWVEEVKDKIKLADRLGYWPFDNNSRNFTAEMKRLTQEVEELRDHKRCHHSKSYINDLREEIDSLTKERDNLSDQIYSNGGYGQQVAQLKAENAGLKGKLDHWHKEAGDQTDARWWNAKEKEKLEERVRELEDI